MNQVEFLDFSSTLFIRSELTRCEKENKLKGKFGGELGHRCDLKN